jgi:hypothetical protein
MTPKMKSVILSTPRVRAILDGRMTMMRQVMLPQPIYGYDCNHECGFFDTGENQWACNHCGWGIDMGGDSVFHAKYQPNDNLWVRETWQHLYPWEVHGTLGEQGRYYYAADGEPNVEMTDDDGFIIERFKWRPSIHMPREAARLFLRVKDVRVERLQDISVQDAKMEGAFHACAMCYHWHDVCGQNVTMARDCKIDDIAPEYQSLWDSLYAERGYGWDTNPWTWVISFERIEKP